MSDTSIKRTGSEEQLIQRQPLTKEAKRSSHSGREYCISTGKAVGAAAIATLLVIGLIGLMVYLGKLNVGLEGVGTMSKATGLYTMIGGGGLAFIGAVLLGVTTYIQHRRNAEKSELV